MLSSFQSSGNLFVFLEHLSVKLTGRLEFKLSNTVTPVLTNSVKLSLPISFQIKQITPVIITTKTQGISASEKEYFINQGRLLLAQMVKVRRKATKLGQKTYVSTLNSLIRTVAQQLRTIGRLKFDKNKVGEILGMLKKKAQDVDADLDSAMRTEMTTEGEKTMTVSTTLPTTETVTAERTETTTVGRTKTVKVRKHM